MDVRTVPAADLDFSRYVRASDTLTWGQSAAEPVPLVRAFAAQCAALARVRVLLGTSFSDAFALDDWTKVDVIALGATGSNARLIASGAADIVPCHLSDVPRFIASGRIRVDVVLVQLATDGDAFNLGVCVDYMPEALAAARVVIAEINDEMPVTCGDTRVESLRIDACVRTRRPLQQMPARAGGDIERLIAGHVARLIPDRAVLQIGIGMIPEAVLAALGSRRDLGIHSGVVGDTVAALMQAGIVTNRYKEVDDGATVAAVLHGTDRIYGYAHRNPQIRMKPYRYTHDAAVLAELSRLFTINSAVEVDLTGQVNAEAIDGRPLGQVGGQVDFVRAGVRSRDGRSIIALPSTARSGVSRIVAALSGPTTTARSDVDLVVTEHGIAELQGVALRERARRLIAIANPDARRGLEAAVDRLV